MTKEEFLKEVKRSRAKNPQGVHEFVDEVDGKLVRLRVCGHSIMHMTVDGLKCQSLWDLGTVKKLLQEISDNIG